MRGTPTLFGRCPARRWHRTRQQFPDGPAMIRDASSHRRRLLATCHAQTLVRRAEVIDGADQVHPLLQGQRAARQRPASACQRRQALTERRIEPLDILRLSRFKPTGPPTPRDTEASNAYAVIHDALSPVCTCSLIGINSTEYLNILTTNLVESVLVQRAKRNTQSEHD